MSFHYDDGHVFALHPDDQFTKLYDIVRIAMIEVVGAERSTRTAHGRYISHSTFAYAKTHENEDQIHEIMAGSRVKPAKFRATHMPLIPQVTNDGHYDWEIVKQAY